MVFNGTFNNISAISWRTLIRFWNFSDGVAFFLVSHFISLFRYSIYRIMPTLKVETDIIASIAASLIGQAVILVTMYCMSKSSKLTILFLSVLNVII